MYARAPDAELTPIQAVLTNVTSYYNYVFQQCIDERANTPVDGMLYEDAAFTDCFMYSFILMQSATATIQDQVHEALRIILRL